MERVKYVGPGFRLHQHLPGKKKAFHPGVKSFHAYVALLLRGFLRTRHYGTDIYFVAFFSHVSSQEIRGIRYAEFRMAKAEHCGEHRYFHFIAASRKISE